MDLLTKFIAGVAFPVLCVWTLGPLAVRALRTGEFEGRGRFCIRAQQPILFWSGVIFCAAMTIFSLWTAYVVLWVVKEA